MSSFVSSSLLSSVISSLLPSLLAISPRSMVAFLLTLLGDTTMDGEDEDEIFCELGFGVSFSLFVFVLSLPSSVDSDMDSDGIRKIIATQPIKGASGLGYLQRVRVLKCRREGGGGQVAGRLGFLECSLAIYHKQQAQQRMFLLSTHGRL